MPPCVQCRFFVSRSASDKSRQIVRERTHFFPPRAAILYLTKRGSAEGGRAGCSLPGRGDGRLYRIRLCGERAPRRAFTLSRPAMHAPSGERMAARARLCRGRGAEFALSRLFAARVAELSRQISRRRPHRGDRLSFAAAQTAPLGLCRILSSDLRPRRAARCRFLLFRRRVCRGAGVLDRTHPRFFRSGGGVWFLLRDGGARSLCAPSPGGRAGERSLRHRRKAHRALGCAVR